ncbi:MAG: hypothetical protein EZS28_043978 [Streblomastix strix]|uniref:Cyclin N-terminal domain-containing protein n=1 Tax=Streblomastix strix TaxID=222440 RepID=A0A5J4TT27_9EUKA|nr:MAG: hypothetical protein EZS28_043978 [Streblomastix strix]
MQSTLTFASESKVGQFADAAPMEQSTKSNIFAQTRFSAKITEAETTATDAMILSSSKFLANALVNSLQQFNAKDILEQQQSYESKIHGFLVFTRSYTMFSGTELVYCVWLIMRLSHVDKDRVKLGHKQQITEENIGTILVCAVELALKMLRDRVCRNSWWSNAFGMDMNTLNASEIVFLKRLDYRLNLDAESFWAIYNALFPSTLPTEPKSL